MAGLVGNPFVDRVIGYGVAGGVTTTIQGGQFGHGFRNAAMSGFISMTVAKVSSGFSTAGRTASAAAAGGSISILNGGKFLNGALTASFQSATNAELENDGPPVVLEGSGDERRAQYEALSVDDQALLRAWLWKNYASEVMDKVSDGATITAIRRFLDDGASDMLHAGEAVHFLGDVAKDGAWRATPHGVKVFVLGKAVLFIPKTVATYWGNDDLVDYREAWRSFEHKEIQNIWHTRLAMGRFARVDWSLYNINNDPVLSVDFFYWVTDRLSVRPPTCAIFEFC